MGVWKSLKEKAHYKTSKVVKMKNTLEIYPKEFLLSFPLQIFSHSEAQFQNAHDLDRQRKGPSSRGQS